MHPNVEELSRKRLATYSKLGSKKYSQHNKTHQTETSALSIMGRLVCDLSPIGMVSNTCHKAQNSSNQQVAGYSVPIDDASSTSKK